MNSLLKMLVNEFGQELLYGLQSVFLLKTIVHGFRQELFYLLQPICKLQIM